jgi:pimeloyl-ACP methyl ester carboxylesterase
MLRILLVVVLGLASAWYTPVAAQWALPAGVKTLEANGYPMSFLESGTGAPVVLVHGAGSDYRSWTRQTASPPHGLRLIAVSLRHHYPEPWNGTGVTYSVQQHAEDQAAFIEALGVGPVFLVGHSRGATVAVRTASARPTLIKKLILMEASVDTSKPAKGGQVKTGQGNRRSSRGCCSAHRECRASPVWGQDPESGRLRVRGAMSASAARRRRHHAPAAGRSPWRRVRQLRGPQVRTWP